MFELVSEYKRCGEAQAFNVLVDARVFGNIGVGLRNIGFRQIVVIITDEIFDGIVRQKRFEFTVKLRRQRFVVRKHQSRAMSWRSPAYRAFTA